MFRYLKTSSNIINKHPKHIENTDYCEYSQDTNVAACVCNEGYTGNYCSTSLCPSGCVNGVCVSPDKCSCTAGWTGDDCSSDSTVSGALIGVIVAFVVVLCVCFPLFGGFVYIFVKTRKPNEGITTWAKKRGWSRWKQIVSAEKDFLDDIKVEELIGAGSFGSVYKGKWHGTAVVALKELKDKMAVEDFLNEVAILKQLKHPNCVQYFGMYVNDAHVYYIVTEYLSSGSAKTLIQNLGPEGLT